MNIYIYILFLKGETTEYAEFIYIKTEVVN